MVIYVIFFYNTSHENKCYFSLRWCSLRNSVSFVYCILHKAFVSGDFCASRESLTLPWIRKIKQPAQFHPLLGWVCTFRTMEIYLMEEFSSLILSDELESPSWRLRLAPTCECGKKPVLFKWMSMLDAYIFKETLYIQWKFAFFLESEMKKDEQKKFVSRYFFIFVMILAEIVK